METIGKALLSIPILLIINICISIIDYSSGTNRLLVAEVFILGYVIILSSL
jgi:hypothetical protein